MELPRKIVVGLDLDPKTCKPSAGSSAAARTALWIAGRTGAHVTLTHSVVRDEYFDPAMNELVPLCENVSPEARLAVAELVGQFRANDVACETLDSSERPSLAILREVQVQHADLVLLGKHDGREADATRIGPIAIRVLRECPSVVWTVVPERPTEPRRVVAATDFSSAGEEAVRWAGWITELCEADLHVIHVHPPTLHSRGADSESHMRRLEELMLRPLSDTQRERAQSHLRETAPAQGVLSLVEELEPDLVCLGLHSRGPTSTAAIGSTAEKLLARLDTSILTLKPT